MDGAGGSQPALRCLSRGSRVATERISWYREALSKYGRKSKTTRSVASITPTSWKSRTTTGSKRSWTALWEYGVAGKEGQKATDPEAYKEYDQRDKGTQQLTSTDVRVGL